MTMSAWGLVLGATTGVALLFVASAVADLRRSELSVRVLPYLRDLPGRSPAASLGLRGELLGRMARRVERVLGGAASVRRRLERAGVVATEHDFRVEQVV
ncbi:MAG TPA: hypothetical protein VLI04_09840 [Nocardioidaceae bacterium]|nr:hypothetical protein [Nocardioidaceae bacterium]